uniref:Uncharacterized protein n=1 Tax=Anguilla anguilla TaxID=7936 RepID=A0A0E9RLX4_ANGAN
MAFEYLSCCFVFFQKTAINWPLTAFQVALNLIPGGSYPEATSAAQKFSALFFESLAS